MFHHLRADGHALIHVMPAPLLEPGSLFSSYGFEDAHRDVEAAMQTIALGLLDSITGECSESVFTSEFIHTLDAHKFMLESVALDCGEDLFTLLCAAATLVDGSQYPQIREKLVRIITEIAQRVDGAMCPASSGGGGGGGPSTPPARTGRRRDGVVPADAGERIGWRKPGRSVELSRRRPRTMWGLEAVRPEVRDRHQYEQPPSLIAFVVSTVRVCSRYCKDMW